MRRRRGSAAGPGGQLDDASGLRHRESGVAALGPRPALTATPSSATTSAAAVYLIGRQGSSRSTTGWPISSRWSKPLGWSAFRCWACPRAARWRSPTRPAIPRGSASWCCAAAYARGRGVRAVSADETARRGSGSGAGPGRLGPRRSRIPSGLRGAVPSRRQPVGLGGLRPTAATHHLAGERRAFPDRVRRHRRLPARRRRCAARRLILHSRDDHRVPMRCGEELAALIPESRLVTLASNNHLLTASEPAWQVLVARSGASWRPDRSFSTKSPRILHATRPAKSDADDMRKQFRILAVGVAAMLALGTVAACSGGSGTESTSPAPLGGQELSRSRRTTSPTYRWPTARR